MMPFGSASAWKTVLSLASVAVALGAPSLFGGINPSRSAIQAKLQDFVDQPRFSGALWGVKVMSLDYGDVIFTHHADRLMSPASNAKLYAGAVALDRLGGDYRITTPLLATQAPDANGVLTGDLVISGRGDPSWNAQGTKREFMQIFEPLVAAVEKAGIRTITGDIVADATWLRVPPAGSSWTVDDLNDDFGAEISAITIEDNYADLRVRPGAAAGEACNAEFVQPFTGLKLDNRTQTVAADGPRRVTVLRVPGETTVQIFGTLPVGGKEELVDVTVPRPAAWFAAGLKAALEQKGITVRGGVRALRWPELAPDWSKAVEIGAVTSAPMRDLVKGFMKPSQNLETDLIFLHMGESRRTAQTPARTDSNDLALAELHALLCENALHADDVIFDEGSGLSRNNLLSAQSTVSLLRFMHAHREAAAYEASLPIAGVDGTLRRRFKGTVAEGNLKAKTGTLRWVASMSGFVTTANGEHLVFSLMLNRYANPPGVSAHDEVEALAKLMIGDDAKK